MRFQLTNVWLTTFRRLTNSSHFSDGGRKEDTSFGDRCGLTSAAI
jgi:hypothetical protein